MAKNTPKPMYQLKLSEVEVTIRDQAGWHTEVFDIRTLCADIVEDDGHKVLGIYNSIAQFVRHQADLIKHTVELADNHVSLRELQEEMDNEPRSS